MNNKSLMSLKFQNTFQQNYKEVLSRTLFENKSVWFKQKQKITV